MLEQRDRLHFAGLDARLHAHAVRLQRFERRRRRVPRGNVEALDRADRLAEPLADSRRGSADAREHVGLRGGLRLIARQRVARAAGLRFERDHVGGGERRDRSEQDRLYADPFAQIARDGGGQRLVRRPLHQLQRRSHL